MSSHPELYVEALTYTDAVDPQIVIACGCGYKEWFYAYKFTILDIENFTEQFKKHWQTDCLKTKGE